MMSRIRDLLERQAVDLGHLQDREVGRVLRGLEDARRELRAKLAATTLPASQHQLQYMLAQTDSAILELQDRMGQALGAGERTMHQRSLDNLVDVVSRSERTFRDHGAKIEVATLRRFAAEEGLALHQYSVQRYGRQVVDAIQREVVSGYAQGLTPQQLARRIAGVDGVVARHKGRAELIARMELARAYDAGHQAALEETAAYDPPDTDDPLLKKADEFLDHRNHPFSRLLHGRAVRPRQEWEVPVSGAARRGLVWRVTGNIAHGMGYPAHFNDRGRQIPWRASWGGQVHTSQVSFRSNQLTETDRRALRALDRGDQTRGLTRVGRRRLELAGYVDGQGRITPEGRAVLTAMGRRRVVGQPDYAHERPQAERLLDVLHGGQFDFGGRYGTGIDGTWTSGGVPVPVSLKRVHADDPQAMMRKVRKNQRKIRKTPHRGVVGHYQCTALRPDEVRAAIEAANPNQLPDWSLIDRVILDFGDEVLLWNRDGVVKMR